MILFLTTSNIPKILTNNYMYLTKHKIKLQYLFERQRE